MDSLRVLQIPPSVILPLSDDRLAELQAKYKPIIPRDSIHIPLQNRPSSNLEQWAYRIFPILSVIWIFAMLITTLIYACDIHTIPKAVGIALGTGFGVFVVLLVGSNALICLRWRFGWKGWEEKDYSRRTVSRTWNPLRYDRDTLYLKNGWRSEALSKADQNPPAPGSEANLAHPDALPTNHRPPSRTRGVDTAQRDHRASLHSQSRTAERHPTAQPAGPRPSSSFTASYIDAMSRGPVSRGTEPHTPMLEQLDHVPGEISHSEEKLNGLSRHPVAEVIPSRRFSRRLYINHPPYQHDKRLWVWDGIANYRESFGGFGSDVRVGEWRAQSLNDPACG